MSEKTVSGIEKIYSCQNTAVHLMIPSIISVLIMDGTEYMIVELNYMNGKSSDFSLPFFFY